MWRPSGSWTTTSVDQPLLVFEVTWFCRVLALTLLLVILWVYLFFYFLFSSWFFFFFETGVNAGLELHPPASAS
jgi:hypothetical protein